jgi:hypothetical protein
MVANARPIDAATPLPLELHLLVSIMTKINSTHLPQGSWLGKYADVVWSPSADQPLLEGTDR